MICGRAGHGADICCKARSFADKGPRLLSFLRFIRRKGRKNGAHVRRKIARRQFDLPPDPARAYAYLRKILRALIDKRFEPLFHADGRTAPVNISGKRFQFALLNHGDRFHAGRFCRQF